MIEKDVKQVVKEINDTLSHLLMLAEQIEDHVGFVAIKLLDLAKMLED
jgi:hypothetical protein